jgi:SOS response regulatory protein OraA/RecX
MRRAVDPMGSSRRRTSGCVIAEIAVDPRRPSRCRLRLADGSSISLATLDAERLGLDEGRRWDRAARHGHARLQRVQQARRASLRLLARRPHPAAAIEHRLREAGFRPAEIREAIRGLREDGWIDDRRWAAAKLATLRRRSLCSRLHARRELRKAGIAAGIVRDLLDRDYPPDAEVDAIVGGLAGRVASRGLPVPSLLRRGFTKATIAIAAARIGRSLAASRGEPPS